MHMPYTDGERHRCGRAGPCAEGFRCTPRPPPQISGSVLDIYACISHPQIKTFVWPPKPVPPPELSCCQASPSTQPLDWKPKLYLLSSMSHPFPPQPFQFLNISWSCSVVHHHLLPGSLQQYPHWVSLAESGPALVPVRSIFLHKAARVLLFLATLAKFLIF